jgi:hypothetical protein
LRFSDYDDKLRIHHRNVSILTSLSAQATDELNLSATLPYHFLRIDGDSTHPTSREDGIGDMTLTTTWSPWPFEADPKQLWDYRRLSFIGGFRFPTGDHRLSPFAGAAGEIVPLGSGTYDLLLGVAYGAPLGESWRLLNTFLLTVPTNRDDREPPPGTVLGSKSALSAFDRLGVFHSFGEVLSGFIALDFLWKDRTGGSAVAKDAGGFFLWASPGIVIQGPGGTLIDVSGEIPLAEGNPSVTLAFSIKF